MKIILKVLIAAFAAEWTAASIAGLSYMDPSIYKQQPVNMPPRGDNPSLYWYPRRNVPRPSQEESNKPPNFPPRPSPGPYQPPEPYQPQIYNPPAPYPELPPPPPPSAVMPLPPYGIPMAPPHPMLPGLPYPFIPPPFPYFGNQPGFGAPPRPHVGMVPGVPGLVSPDGGVNIMPMSDVLSDFLEEHKQKILRKRFQKLVEIYDRKPWARKYRSRKNQRRRSRIYDY